MVSRYGGRLNFLLKMGPYVVDPSSVVCKPAYGGNVYLYYSLDSGDTWETLVILETFSYRGEEFTEVNISDSPTSLLNRPYSQKSKIRKTKIRWCKSFE